MAGLEIILPTNFYNPLLPTVPVYGFKDTFNRADNSTGLGYTSAEGKPWERLQGLNAFGAKLTGNKAVPYDISGNSAAWAAEVVDAQTANGTLKATLVTPGSLAGGLTFRAASNVDFLTLMMRSTSTNSSLVLAKKVAGVTTTIATSASQGLGVAGAVIEVVLSGTSVTVKVNGTTAIATQTVTEQVANTKHGLYLTQVSLDMAWDDVSFTPA